MAQDGATHDTQGHGGTRMGRAGENEQQCRNEFGDTRTDASPRFNPERAEDVNGFRGSGEFEPQGLDEDDGRYVGGDPGDPRNGLHVSVRHVAVRSSSMFECCPIPDSGRQQVLFVLVPIIQRIGEEPVVEQIHSGFDKIAKNLREITLECTHSKAIRELRSRDVIANTILYDNIQGIRIGVNDESGKLQEAANETQLLEKMAV